MPPRTRSSPSKPSPSSPRPTPPTSSSLSPQANGAHRPNPLHLPELLRLILHHLPPSDLAQCLSVSSLWFDCAVQGLYRVVRVVDLLRLVEAGRKEKGGPSLGGFRVTLADVGRLSKYTPHITTLTCSSSEYKHRPARHAWKAAGRSYALVPMDPLEQLSVLLQDWHSLLLSHPQFLPSQRQLRPGEIPTMPDLFPRLCKLKGAFGLEDELGALVSLDFTLPLSSPSSFLSGLCYPWQQAYGYSMERELRGTELLLRCEEAYACLTEMWPYFFFFLRQSGSMRELELAALWDLKSEPAEGIDWRARWQEDGSVPYPEKSCELRRLVLRAPKPGELFERLMEEDMLGPRMERLEELYFGVENEVEVEEWEMSEDDDEEEEDEEEGSEGEGAEGVHFVVEDAEMSDAGSLEEGEMTTEESEEETDTDVSTSDSSSGSDDDDAEAASHSGSEHEHDAIMSVGSPAHGEVGEGEGEDEWQTEDEIQVDASSAAAAEALFTTELIPGRLPAYFEEGYKPPPGVRFASQLKDGLVLSKLCKVVGRGCPALKVLGWDGRGVVRVGEGWSRWGEEERAGWLEREVRRVLEGR